MLTTLKYNDILFQELCCFLGSYANQDADFQYLFFFIVQCYQVLQLTCKFENFIISPQHMISFKPFTQKY